MALFVAALIADIYIYRCLIATHTRRLLARVLYIVLAVITDGAAFAALMLYGAAAHRVSVGMVAVMWLVWLFLIAFVPKALYTVGGVLDFLAGRLARRRISPFRWLGIVLAVVVMGVMISGVTVGRTQLRVEQVEVCSERVPEAFDGYRIVQFSDLHVATMLHPERQLARLVETVNAQRGDMIAGTGDLVSITHEELTPAAARILARLEAPDGVWSAWGNHDLGFYIRDGSELTPEANLAALSEKVRAMGWRTLSDSSVVIRHGRDSLLLTGLAYPHDRMLNSHNESLAGVDPGAAYRGVEGDPFNVVLAHTPRLWGEITSAGRGDLTLSGHVHAMQTKLRSGSWLWSPAQRMYDQWSGKYTSGRGQKNSVLYVNDGIGCVGYPMRIGARGEITVITLKRCE
jgi:predicted MPP superfamily phosphohydrolase